MADLSPDQRDPQQTPDWELLARRMSGEGSGAESLHPDDQRVLDALGEVIGASTPRRPAGLDVEAALKRTKARFGETPVVPISRPNVRKPSFWVSPAFRIAAGLGIALVGVYAWNGRSTGAVAGPEVAQTHVAPRGGPDSLTLADGSEVILAPGSELTVEAGYGADRRQLTLKGQGWFRVVHDDAKPFVVTAQGAEVRDIGTVFVVDAENSRGVRVSVQEGSVAVRATAQQPETTLGVGDVATVNRAGVTEVARGSASAEDASWASGELRFRDVTLEALAGTLERWYGVRVEVDGSLRGQRVSTSLNGGTVKSVLNEVAMTLAAEVEWAGDTATVRRRGSMR